MWGLMWVGASVGSIRARLLTGLWRCSEVDSEFLQEQGALCKSIGAVYLIGRHFLEFLRLRDMYFLLSTTFCGLALLAVKSEPLERLHYHTSRPGLCINTADLFPFQDFIR